jgi:two-component system cell cycle sensor histidine kinase/response regulator CckA
VMEAGGRTGDPSLDELMRVAEELPHVVWITHPDDRTDYFNRRGAEYLGISRDESYDEAWEASIHPEDLERTLAAWAEALAGEREYHCEYRLRAADGTYRWNASRGNPIRDADGRVSWWIGTCTDIDDTVRAERALAASEDRWQALAEAGTEAVMVHDGATIVDANRALGELFGYPREELIGMAMRSLDGFGDLGPCWSLNGKEQHDRTCTRRDGKRIVVETSSRSCDYLGRRVCVTTMRDVTQQRRTERERDNLAQLADRSRDFIGLARLDGTVFYLNPAGRALVGLLPDQSLDGILVEDFSEPEDVDLMKQRVLPMLLGAGTWHGTWRFRHFETGESVEVDAHRFLVRDERTGEPRFIANISRDLSERNRLEEQLRHAQKMEAVARLAGGVAHDFNNILTVVRGYTQLLLESLEDGTALADVAEIASAADRASALTSQLFAFGRRDPLAPRVLDLDLIVADMERLLRRLIGEHIQLVARRSTSLGNVCADPGQIEQVIANLVVNARDAMPAGGTVTLATANVDLETTLYDGVLAAPAGPYVLITVADTGVGIDEETRQRVFEPFFTTKPAPEGTGLGLAMVYGIVEGLGGDLRVESRPGAGARFEVYLPRVAESAMPELPPAAGDHGGETVLLVEDDPAVRNVVRRMLEGLGYAVVEASGAINALEQVAETAVEVDLLLSDVVMPVMSGPELAVEIRRLRPRVRVLFVSGFSDRHVDGSLLQKPFTVAQLGSRVRQVLDELLDLVPS